MAHAADLQGAADGTILFQAYDGETNVVSAAPTNLGLRIRDTGAPLSARGDCRNVNDHEALCGQNSSIFVGPCDCPGPRVQFVLMDRDDSFTGSGFGIGYGVDGRDGNDLIKATDGRLFAEGGEGDDRLVGGDNYDELAGGPGSDFMKGNGGIDTVSYKDDSDGVRVTLDGIANDGIPGEGDNAQAEGVTGGAGQDHITGNDADNWLMGGEGDDLLEGGAGRDQIGDSGGSDRIEGGAGGDHLGDSSGGGVIRGGPGDDIVSGGYGTDQLFGGSGPRLVDLRLRVRP